MLASTLPPWLTVGGALVAGFAAGTISALLGIGGASVTTPVVRLLGGTPLEAVGSTVPAIVPGAISGSWRYAREGLVQWRIALTLGITGSVMALVGALASDVVDGRLLMVATALVMLWAGTTVLRQLRLARTGGRSRRTPLPTTGGAPGTAAGDRGANDVLVAALGASAGFTAGLLGVGGGVLLVPVLSGPLRLPMRQAVASSLVAVAAFQIPALITHVWLGHVNWTIAVPLAIGVIPGAQLGAKLTVAASDRTIRTLFGMLIVVLAVVYGLTELRGLIAGG